jgi:hypothetical protein
MHAAKGHINAQTFLHIRNPLLEGARAYHKMVYTCWHFSLAKMVVEPLTPLFGGERSKSYSRRG